MGNNLDILWEYSYYCYIENVLKSNSFHYGNESGCNMREYMKKQLIDLLNTIEEAHYEMVNYCKTHEYDLAISVFTSCQEAAITVGTKIEECEGEGTKTVSLLEEYCELLYEFSCNITETDFRIEKVIKHLNRKLQGIISSLKNDIKEKKEIVFLPYKAAMWDSLESVWKKARDNPDYDVYVVPIPYYSLNPDRSPKEVFYEGEDYPPYVPITSFKEYSIPDRKPDIIYIHNPYDNCNKVTSVFPEYYSSNLKKYTNELVYIPYFVCFNDEVSDHFIVLPATIHAHKVIVQSSKVREKYIRVMRQYLKDEGINEAVIGDLEEKFSVMRSPKIDKVLAITRDNVDIPGDWKRYIDEGENRKKIIMYNTTLQAFFDFHDKYLDKIKRTLEIFKANKNTILLWRPHPLMKDSMAAMYPVEYEKYVEIVEEYKSQGWGIYDDTSDLNRAIALSDAYYGDMSSVVELYRMTGKPIMIQNINI
ncbi:MAG: hypothetical protein E7265_01930 [Lachnospiraceae bacterium]|nr:hypothetical protein [Lachnospiraceae bacterium]